MNSRRSIYTYLTVFLVLALFLVACERPFRPDTGGDVNVPAGEDVGEPAGEEAAPEDGYPAPVDEGEVAEEPQAPAEDEAPPPAEDEPEAPPEDEPEAPVEEEAPPAADEPVDDEPAGEEPPADEEVAQEEEAAGEDEGAGVEGSEGSEEAPPAGEATGEVTHTVAEGETLFDIADQYGVSWITLADHNDISDTGAVTAGMVLVIPTAAEEAPPVADEPAGEEEEEAAGEEDEAAEEGEGEEVAEEAAEEAEEEAAGTGGEPVPTPSAAQETTYVVQRGDNLFRIGLRFGISWVQIAEANGIVNPNRIYAGQELKIPVPAPGPNPEFTHVVQRGENLFRIALRYGVTWQAIAQRNQIGPPYVIYPGMTLLIPGNGS